MHFLVVAVESAHALVTATRLLVAPSWRAPLGKSQGLV